MPIIILLTIVVIIDSLWSLHAIILGLSSGQCFFRMCFVLIFEKVFLREINFKVVWNVFVNIFCLNCVLMGSCKKWIMPRSHPVLNNEQGIKK
jgi:hypothetical protein